MAVSIDKPGFMFNPTSCDPMSIDATFSSPTAADVSRSARFKVADCGSLRFQPKLAMRLTGKRQTKTGGHPGLRSILTQPAGQGSANIANARIVLPKSVVLDPNNSTDPKLVCGYDEGAKADCPASSVIGKAVANSPVLDRPLTGDVHLVQGIRFGANGNRIRTTPDLLVKLRGEVDINVRAKTTVTADGSSRRSPRSQTHQSPSSASTSTAATTESSSSQGPARQRSTSAPPSKPRTSKPTDTTAAHATSKSTSSDRAPRRRARPRPATRRTASPTTNQPGGHRRPATATPRGPATAGPLAFASKG